MNQLLIEPMFITGKYESKACKCTSNSWFPFCDLLIDVDGQRWELWLGTFADLHVYIVDSEIDISIMRPILRITYVGREPEISFHRSQIDHECSQPEATSAPDCSLQVVNAKDDKFKVTWGGSFTLSQFPYLRLFIYITRVSRNVHPLIRSSLGSMTWSTKNINFPESTLITYQLLRSTNIAMLSIRP
jgi:hypothetical protein